MVDMGSEKCEILREMWIKFLEKWAPAESVQFQETKLSMRVSMVEILYNTLIRSCHKNEADYQNS